MLRFSFPSSKPVKPLGTAVAAMSEGAPLAAPENYAVCNRGSERQILGRYVVMGCFREAQAPRPPTCRAAWTLARSRATRWAKLPIIVHLSEQPAIPARRRVLGKPPAYPLKT
jgi:hypothetical protein